MLKKGFTCPGVVGFDAHKNKYQNGKYHSNKYLRFVVTCKGHLLEGQGYDAQNLAVDPFDLGPQNARTKL